MKGPCGQRKDHLNHKCSCVLMVVMVRRSHTWFLGSEAPRKWKQQLLKMMLVLQMAPAIPVESFQSFYYLIFSSEFNVSISLNLTGVADDFFFFSKNADLGSVTLQEQSCENTYQMHFCFS